MSGDETLVLIVCCALGVIGWIRWIGPLVLLKNQEWKSLIHLPVLGAPVLSLGTMFLVLRHWASHDVQNDVTYIVFYLGMWFGWTGVLLRLLPYLGLSVRDDALERNNPAAALAIGGALLGITLAFAGGNIGDGPGWWVVVFSSGLASLTLLLLWLVWNLFIPVAEAITVDRDTASGWRVAGFFIGGGLIVGRAAAGNWISAGVTFHEFVGKGFLVLILWAIAVAVDFKLRPSPLNPGRAAVPFGAIPALLYIMLGALVASRQGAW